LLEREQLDESHENSGGFRSDFKLAALGNIRGTSGHPGVDFGATAQRPNNIFQTSTRMGAKQQPEQEAPQNSAGLIQKTSISTIGWK
jgi:hypothetical protein